MTEQQRFTPKQLGIVFTIAAVQFVNILDFVMVMPLGPDFAKSLGISEAQVGTVAAGYTAAAGLSGFLGSFFLDRFDRRKALAVSLAGLALGTALGGLAQGMATLIAARVVAGFFGGPATSLSFSIVSDAIPTTMRGRAIGIVMGAFSVASVVGVPLGLYLAELSGWRAPFFAVAGLGALINVAAIALLPPMREHLDARHRPVSLKELLGNSTVLLSFTMTACVMAAGFSVIPNISAYLQMNLSFPRDHLKYAYMFGGVASFFATQYGGRFVDRFGSFRVGTAGAASVIAVVAAMYVPAWQEWPVGLVYAFFMAFMLANGVRNVSYNTLASKVPAPQVRARFQSLQSAVQHGASALAAVAAAQVLGRAPRPDGQGQRLTHMDWVAMGSITLTLIIPVLLFVVERRVKAQAAKALQAPTSGARSPA